MPRKTAHAIRATCEVPIVIFGYYNPIFVRGESATAAAAGEAGADALLVVDLPVEVQTDLRAAAHAHGLALIPLLAPTSSPSRNWETAAPVLVTRPMISWPGTHG